MSGVVDEALRRLEEYLRDDDLSDDWTQWKAIGAGLNWKIIRLEFGRLTKERDNALEFVDGLLAERNRWKKSSMKYKAELDRLRKEAR